MTVAVGPAPTTTMSNGECYGSDGTSRRYTESLFADGEAAARDDDNWYESYNVDSLLRDAPVDSIRQQTRVDREDSFTDAVDKDDVSQKVDLDFVDGQVNTHYTISCRILVCVS